MRGSRPSVEAALALALALIAVVAAGVFLVVNGDEGDPAASGVETAIGIDGASGGVVAPGGPVAGDPDSDNPVDSGRLHDLADELAAGLVDVDRQRAVIAADIATLAELEPVDGEPEADLLGILRSLDGALEAGDFQMAAALAASAHGFSHAIDDHG